MGTTKELPAARRERILGLVQDKGFARISEVSESLQVAPITVRRDIAQLAEEGLVLQVRGGARAMTTTAGAAHAPTPAPAPAPLSTALSPAAPMSPAATSSVSRNAAVGVIVPTFRYYWPEIIHGVSATADALGMKIMLQGSAERARETLRQARGLVGDGIATGLLLAPKLDDDGTDELRAFLEDIELPLVLIERTLRPQGPYARGFESVTTDHRGGGNMAARHLAALGHTHLAVFTYKDTPTQEHMREGWDAAVKDLGLDSFTRTTLSSAAPAPDGDPSASARDVEQFIDECLERGVTGVLAHSDECALVLVEHLTHRGVRVPADMSIIAYDDVLAELARPALTAIAPPKRMLGELALRMLAERIADPSRPMMRVELQPSLMDRGSTAPPRTA